MNKYKVYGSDDGVVFRYITSVMADSWNDAHSKVENVYSSYAVLDVVLCK